MAVTFFIGPASKHQSLKYLPCSLYVNKTNLKHTEYGDDRLLYRSVHDLFEFQVMGCGNGAAA